MGGDAACPRVSRSRASGVVAMTEAKRHHFVPEFYLLRFADTPQVFVRRRDQTVFEANCLNVAVESGFYDYEMSDGEQSKEVEERLGVYETSTAEVLRCIDETLSAPATGSHERAALCAYLALQMTRTPEHRERMLFPELLREYLADRELTRELVSTYLETVHLGFKPDAREVEGAFTFAAVALQSGAPITAEVSMDAMFESIEQVAPRLDAFSWCVEYDRKGRLITSDTPLVLWRVPTDRDAFEGFGIEGCDEIRFPISPTAQLVLTKRPRPAGVRITPERTAACNADMALACHKFVVSNPRERARVDRLDLPRKRPVLRFNVGPLIRESSDGTEAIDGEVLHLWIPRR